MRRRRLLAAVALGSLGLSGCLNRGASDDDGDPSTDGGSRADDGPQTDDGSPTDGGSPETTNETGTDPATDGDEADPDADRTDATPTIPEPSGRCGPAAEPLSDRLTDIAGEDCQADLVPSVVVANERETAVSIALGLGTEAEPTEELSLELDPGERVVERPGVEAGDLTAASVTFANGTEHTARFPETSCRRHGVAIEADGVAAGVLAPLDGHADTQHGCYTADTREFTLWNRASASHEVTVTRVDHCAETVETSRHTLGPGSWVDLEAYLTSGGRYAIAVNVHGAGATTYDYDAECWSLQAQIRDGGEPDVHLVGTY